MRTQIRRTISLATSAAATGARRTRTFAGCMVWICLFLPIMPFLSWAQTEQASTSSADFDRVASLDRSSGAYPTAGLIQGTDHNLYGTAYSWGEYGGGTVFRVTPEGSVERLYSFCSENACTDGANPDAPLVQARDGNFYGTTLYGGTAGDGTVFKITPSGTLTTLYSFCSQSACADGSNPAAPLVQASDGNFYGTTESGGANSNGTVFKITASGTLTTLHSFAYSTDGDLPLGGLIQANDGNLYGTTTFGGPHGGDGTVFKMTLGGTLTTLHNFCLTSGCADGALPEATLVQAADGNLYGTTVAGGGGSKCTNGSLGCGSVFRIALSGTLTTLYGFCSESGCADGAFPFAPLVQASDKNFYGTTSGGGNSACEPFGRCGTAFKITESGTLTTLHKLCSESECADGEYPYAGLVQATDGKLYGTAQFGGLHDSCAYGCGMVFSLCPDLATAVEMPPMTAKVGAPVEILGNELEGATSVTLNFNGTPAVSQAISGSGTEATVPAGAPAGFVPKPPPTGRLKATSSSAERVTSNR